jgi:hypothetical protein
VILLGDWGRWVRDPIDLIRLSFLVGALVTLAIGPREQAFRLLLTFLLVLVPRAIDAPRPFDFAFCLGMAFQAWGNVFAAFDTVPLYDKLVHLILPWATSMLLYLLLVRINVVPALEEESAIHTRAALLLVTFAFGMSVGALYEMYEYFGNHVLGAHLHVSYGDTIADLTADAVGSTLGGLTMVAWDRYGWASRRRVPGRLLER